MGKEPVDVALTKAAGSAEMNLVTPNEADGDAERPGVGRMNVSSVVDRKA